MKPPRILARTLVINEDKILLARNKGAKFWYPAGGGWEYEQETILECAAREVKEESGYDIVVDKMLWLQEFHTEGKIFFETFWLARLDESIDQSAHDPAKHIDLDPNGAVEEVQWFTQSELVGLTVFPKRVKEFEMYITAQKDLPDPFIGAFL